MLKHDLATSYDYNLDSCYKNLDDCNFGFIDTSNLKRFLVKCCIYASDALLIAIIRRMDLDADARLSRREFFDGIQPQENFTKGSLTEMKRTVKKSARAAASSGNNFRKTQSLGKRPMTAAMKRSSSPYGQTGTYNNMLGASASINERNFMQRNNGYQQAYGSMRELGGS